MNYLYSGIGLYPNGEINYLEYELPTINKNHVDERKGIDPNGVVKDNLGCIWYFYQDGNVDIGVEKQISKKSIDFNRNGKIEKNYKFNFYFGNSKGNGKVHMADIARETINEWEHLIYKPEENNMVTENTKVITAEGYEIDPLYEPPFEAYWFLGEDEPNKYNLDGIIIYNENDDQFYYEISIENKGKTKTIADITTESEELKFNLKNEKVELPKHTDNTISQVKMYVPVKDDLNEKSHFFPIIKKYIDGNEEIESEGIDLGWGGYEGIKEERRINEQLSQDKVTVIYTIDDYTGRFTYNAFGKKYTLPCEAYQNEDGIWTSDAVDNFDKYVEEAIKSDIENNYTQSIIKQPNNPPIYLIMKVGFGITLVLMLSLIIIFIKKFIINNKDGEYYH